MGKWSPRCPRCSSVLAYRDGSDRKGKQRYRCKVCGRTYVGNRAGIREDIREIAASLLLEGIPVPTLAKAMRRHCSRRWLYNLKTSLVDVSR